MQIRTTTRLEEKVRNILARRDGSIWFVAASDSVYHALEMMAEKQVGALLVTSEDGKLAGIISERDYARKIALHGKSSKDVQVQDIMTSPAIFVSPEYTVDDCLRIMTSHRIRHLPLVERDRVVEVVSIRDLVNWIISEHARTIDRLQNYIMGG